MDSWLVIAETGTAAAGTGSVPEVAVTDLAVLTGWAPKPEGWCRGDECIPASLIGPGATDDPLRIETIAAALDTPTAIDPTHRIAVVGARSERGSGLSSGQAPDVELVDVDGNPRRLFDSAPDKTLVVAFSSWCGCRYDLPGWKLLRDELADDGFAVVAVAIDESTADVAPWAETVDLPVLVDTDRAFADAYGLTNVPTVIWVDRDRNVVRPPTREFSNDDFAEFHGIESGPHLESVRRWVRDDEMPSTDGPVADTGLTADQRQARVEFRLALELLRRGERDAAAERIALADSLASDDLTIWRAGMKLVGDDPFGPEFLDRYLDWESRHGGPARAR